MFFYGYVLTQLPGGRLAELFGAKWLFGGGGSTDTFILISQEFSSRPSSPCSPPWLPSRALPIPTATHSCCTVSELSRVSARESPSRPCLPFLLAGHLWMRGAGRLLRISPYHPLADLPLSAMLGLLLEQLFPCPYQVLFPTLNIFT